jgi:DVNP family
MVESRAVVMHRGGHTAGGLSKTDLKYNKKGEIVSKKKSQQEKKNPWIQAVQKAEKKLVKKGDLVKGEFHPVTGKLLTEARKIYSK